MTSITAIKDQLCNPHNKNLPFIKLKQVLNCKVHSVGGGRPLGSYFCRFLYVGIYCSNFYPLENVVIMGENKG